MLVQFDTNVTVNQLCCSCSSKHSNNKCSDLQFPKGKSSRVVDSDARHCMQIEQVAFTERSQYQRFWICTKTLSLVCATFLCRFCAKFARRLRQRALQTHQKVGKSFSSDWKIEKFWIFVFLLVTSQLV